MTGPGVATPLLRDREELYVGGEWVRSGAGATIEVENPATEEIVARVVSGDADDVERAVRAARQAWPGWAARPVEDRAHLITRLADELEARRHELGVVTATEIGMPLPQATATQAGMPVEVLRTTARVAETYPWRQELSGATVVREPAGVVAAITPWNFPLHQIAAKVGPALLAGCAVVLKPSGIAPLNAYAFAECVARAGLPPGVFNLVTGPGRQVGEALVTHPDVAVVSLTGSVASGARVGQLAAAGIKRCCLELGGKSANVLLDDADLDLAIPSAVQQGLSNSGQACNALTRILVGRDRLGEVEERLVAAVEALRVGDPFAAGTDLGPVVSAGQRDSIRGHVVRALAAGERLLTGGSDAPDGLERGYYVRPSVFSRVGVDAPLVQEEIFGPVLVVQVYEDEHEAVAIANATRFGLSGGVWSADPERARRVASRMRTGQVKVNGVRTRDHFDAPFGGYGQSGVGRELGPFGIDEFVETKSILR
ncbi:aldehyde dehydrogenase family protein [Xylanimonas allomyrinae]|uniref:aldehyde dehydrogenase (NAD(+)) n=1 Tax=Xylanimonas allomyrinae TaxID=2509459 RepID=A0A4P6ELZ5_9MICO|nr:aldehyde dehydrogenase family protein [Xylanimonas allomyrinae]QAY62289.1 aldehyde dehydrogenase family protein [Xylanimonas allomyrinae]